MFLQLAANAALFVALLLIYTVNRSRRAVYAGGLSDPLP
jgi:hypothetical protein